MKVALIASMGLAALFILVPGANAQQTSTTVSLVQKFQPVTRSYPGVAADILGIQTGMTVSQAEAIAEKTYPGKANEGKSPYSFSYKDVSIQTDPFVSTVTFGGEKGDTSDVLNLGFTSPATGNRLLYLSRKISFSINDLDSSIVNAPLQSTLIASLTKKYGPPSFQDVIPYPQSVIGWIFTQNSRIVCKNGRCVEGKLSVAVSDLTAAFANYFIQSQPISPDCTDYTYSGAFFFTIVAVIRGSLSDETKATSMSVSIGDEPTCVEDSQEALKQMKSAAIKFYNSRSKTPAAPKL